MNQSVCPSIRLSVYPSVRLFVCPSAWTSRLRASTPGGEAPYSDNIFGPQNLVTYQIWILS